jgi:hypothetical protein
MMREKLTEAIALALIPDDVPPTTMELHGEDLWKTYLDDADTCLSAIEAMGYVIVPKVATPEMIAAVRHGSADVYDAMIEAGKV